MGGSPTINTQRQSFYCPSRSIPHRSSEEFCRSLRKDLACGHWNWSSSCFCTILFSMSNVTTSFESFARASRNVRTYASVSSLYVDTLSMNPNEIVDPKKLTLTQNLRSGSHGICVGRGSRELMGARENLVGVLVVLVDRLATSIKEVRVIECNDYGP